MPGDDLGDVRGEAVEDGVGDEDAPEVVRGVSQRRPGSAGDAGAGDRGVEDPAHGPVVQCLVVVAEAALEQQRGWRQPPAFVVVVGGDQGDGPGRGADAVDDGGQGVGEAGADQQEPLGVGLGRGDLQQGDQLAGARQPVLDQAVVAELEQLSSIRMPVERSTSMAAQAQNA